jgi:hypothetical protein
MDRKGMLDKTSQILNNIFGKKRKNLGVLFEKKDIIIMIEQK